MVKQAYNTYFIFSIGIWLYLMSTWLDNVFSRYLILFLFLSFALINLLCIQGSKELNTNTFILGSFTYCILFLTVSFIRLKRDDLGFFESDHFLLQFAPVLFFVGFSFIFGFNDSPIKDTIILPGIDLYTFVSYLVNITFYTLLNIYCIRRFKSSKGWLKK